MAEKIAISLRELRRYSRRTQSQAATAAKMSQPELSRLERREDFLLSTLQAYVGALGGSLEILVGFGSSTFRLTDGESPRGGFTMKDIDAALADLAGLAKWLPAVLGGLATADLRRRVEGCGPFALVEHVCHLRDLEVEGYGVRLDRTLAEDVPALPDFDGERVAAERDYRAQAPAPAVRALLAARRRHLGRLGKLGAAAFRRELDLEGAGRIALGELVLRWRTHDVGHRIEMEGLREALRGRPAAVTGVSPRVS